jgi:hypothetical protein
VNPHEIYPLDDEPTDEEKRLEVLRYLSRDCQLFDNIHKESTDPQTVHEHDHPGFQGEDNIPFDYPEADVLNGLIKEGLLRVQISPWKDGERENPHYNLRHFRLTDKGRQYWEARRQQDDE